MTSIINRYYDPATDQFISVDPAVAATDQPYIFTNDNPLNAEDPTGLKLKCRGKGAPTEAQLIGCENYVITGTPYAPTNTGTTEWSNGLTTFSVIFGLADPFAGLSAIEDQSTADALSFSGKIQGQMDERGWTAQSVRQTVGRPTKTYKLWDYTSGGAREPATAYQNADGGYVVVNNETGNIVQVSNLNKAGWKAPWNDPRFRR